MLEAVAREGDGHRAALRGDAVGARVAYARAIESYRASWEAAPPEAYGRVIGMLKASVLAGAGEQDAAYARAAISDEAAASSPAAAYARAIAALATGDDEGAARHATVMRGGSDAFRRAAAAIEALATGDAAGYREAITAIVRDFEGRDEHLTGVAFADTAAMLETLAAPRGLDAAVASGLLPPVV